MFISSCMLGSVRHFGWGSSYIVWDYPARCRSLTSLLFSAHWVLSYISKCPSGVCRIVGVGDRCSEERYTWLKTTRLGGPPQFSFLIFSLCITYSSSLNFPPHCCLWMSPIHSIVTGYPGVCFYLACHWAILRPWLNVTVVFRILGKRLHVPRLESVSNSIERFMLPLEEKTECIQKTVNIFFGPLRRQNISEVRIYFLWASDGSDMSINNFQKTVNISNFFLTLKGKCWFFRLHSLLYVEWFVAPRLFPFLVTKLLFENRRLLFSLLFTKCFKI